MIKCQQKNDGSVSFVFLAKYGQHFQNKYVCGIREKETGIFVRFIFPILKVYASIELELI